MCIKFSGLGQTPIRDDLALEVSDTIINKYFTSARYFSPLKTPNHNTLLLGKRQQRSTATTL